MISVFYIIKGDDMYFHKYLDLTGGEEKKKKPIDESRSLLSECKYFKIFRKRNSSNYVTTIEIFSQLQ